MSKEGIEGATQKGVGAVKEGLGKALHNDKGEKIRLFGKVWPPPLT